MHRRKNTMGQRTKAVVTQCLVVHTERVRCMEMMEPSIAHELLRGDHKTVRIEQMLDQLEMDDQVEDPPLPAANSSALAAWSVRSRSSFLAMAEASISMPVNSHRCRRSLA